MNRRSFLRGLFGGAATAAAAPLLPDVARPGLVEAVLGAGAKVAEKAAAITIDWDILTSVGLDVARRTGFRAPTSDPEINALLKSEFFSP